MTRTLLLFVFTFIVQSVFAQADKQLLISANYRNLHESFTGTTNTFIYEYKPAELQIGFREKINNTHAHLVFGIAVNNYQSTNIVYPHSELYYMEDVRMYATSESVARVLRPSFEVQTEFGSEKLKVTVGVRGFGAFGLSKLNKLDSRVEYYSYDSLGNMNAQPDTIVYSHLDWNYNDFYVFPKVGVELTGGCFYPITNWASLYGQISIGVARGPKSNPVAVTMSAGAGLAITLTRIEVADK